MEILLSNKMMQLSLCISPIHLGYICQKSNIDGQLFVYCSVLCHTFVSCSLSTSEAMHTSSFLSSPMVMINLLEVF